MLFLDEPKCNAQPLLVRGSALIIRAARPEAHFVMVRNSVARDDRLSFRARGVLVAVLSRPDDWSISAENLAREGQESVQTIYKCLRELEAAGYVQRRRVRNAAGQLRTETLVFDEPQPTDKKPIVGEPNSRATDSRFSSSHTKTDIQRQITKKEQPKASAFAEAGKALCQAWWEAQNPKPLGNWNGLNIVVRKALQAGYTEDSVRAALDRIGAVPSAQQLQRELNNPRHPQSRRQANERKLSDMYADARAKAFAAAKGELQ